ncbi:NifU family protein [Acidobacteriota bacterium]
MKDKVEKVLESVRVHLRAEGGDVELIDVDEDGNVKVRLQGACKGCPGAAMTLKHGIERVLKDAIPEIKSVEAVP